MNSPLGKMVGERRAMTPAEMRQKQAELFHVKRIAWLPIDDIRNPDDRAVVERLCVREYGEPVKGRAR